MSGDSNDTLSWSTKLYKDMMDWLSKMQNGGGGIPFNLHLEGHFEDFPILNPYLMLFGCDVNVFKPNSRYSASTE